MRQIVVKESRFLTTSLTLSLLCYALPSIHSHGIHLLTGHRYSIFFLDLAAQINVFLSIPW